METIGDFCNRYNEHEACQTPVCYSVRFFNHLSIRDDVVTVHSRFSMSKGGH
jgi:hypothetical protein